MRAEAVIGTAGQMLAYLAMQATDGPDLVTKVIAICAGCSLGALVASVLADRATTAQRVRRFVVSFGSGAVLSLVALWMWPTRAGIDPREWIVVVAAIAAFAGWHVVRKADDRVRSSAGAVVDRAAERIGLTRANEQPAKFAKDRDE